MGVVHLEKMENFASTLNNKRRAKLPLPPRTFEEIRAVCQHSRREALANPQHQQ